jgi:hypothetical protein
MNHLMTAYSIYLSYKEKFYGSQNEPSEVFSMGLLEMLTPFEILEEAVTEYKKN